METKEIKLSKIKSKENYRSSNGQDLGSLMESIKQNGLLQPVGVKDLGNDKYELTFGNRRFNAMKKLGRDTITCVMIDDDKDSTILNIVENLQREDTSLFEVGRAIHKLKTTDSMTDSEICARLSVQKPFLKIALEVFNITPPKFRNKVVSMSNVNKSSKKGYIPSTVAAQINASQKRFKLSKTEFEKFYSYASNNELSSKDVTAIMTMLKDGVPLAKALTQKDKIKCFRATVTMRNDEFERLRTKYGKDFVSVLLYSQKIDKIKSI